MLEIICWYWKPTTNYRTQFTYEHVNTLQNMVARHYPHPHRFSVLTDRVDELYNTNIRVIPLWDEHAKRESLYGPDTPSCYRRLKAFSPDMGKIVGRRFVSIDLDVVVVGDLTPVLNRTEDFIIWGPNGRRTPYNGSMWMMDAGARAQVWTRFQENPERCIARARGAGFYGSDQAWICYALGPNEKRWVAEDGVYSFRMHLKENRGELPKDARMVIFEGHYDPIAPATRKLCPWIEEHYR